MIIGLSGYARSGKDTVANLLVNEYGFERVAFADPIRDILYAMNPQVRGDRLVPLVDEYGWDVAKANPEVRLLLQGLGYAARRRLDEEIWIVTALKKMTDSTKNYVVTDVRFMNEANILRNELDAELWRVERPDVVAVNDHISEWELNAYSFDRVLNNDGTLEELEFMIKTFNVNKGI
jgi:dephospho-CoA kinase